MKPTWRGRLCHYCGEPARSMDHIVPRALGGSNYEENLVPACLPCNAAKADMFPTCECLICDAAVALHRESIALRMKYQAPHLTQKIVIPLPQAEHYRDL